MWEFVDTIYYENINAITLVTSDTRVTGVRVCVRVCQVRTCMCMSGVMLLILLLDVQMHIELQKVVLDIAFLCISFITMELIQTY